jgi:hypothetical protein
MILFIVYGDQRLAMTVQPVWGLLRPSTLQPTGWQA